MSPLGATPPSRPCTRCLPSIPHDAPVCEPRVFCCATSPPPARRLPASPRSTHGAGRPGVIAGRPGGESGSRIVPAADGLPSFMRKSSKKSMRIATTPRKTSRTSAKRWSKSRARASGPKPARASAKKALAGNGARRRQRQNRTNTAGVTPGCGACTPVQATGQVIAGIVMVRAAAESRLSLMLGTR